MVRLIGFGVGCLLTVAALVLLIGIPDGRQDRGAPDQARVDALIENAQRKWEERAAVGKPPAPTAEAPAAPIPEDVAQEPGGADVVAAEDTILADPTAPAIDTSMPEVTEWQAVWTPFRTRIAAQGFVARLESVTGLDYRIEKLDTGAYQVLFAYREETGADAGLELIATATGLDLSRDRP